jgi:phage terminase Nu1 subunit (DNA packaging protein)
MKKPSAKRANAGKAVQPVRTLVELSELVERDAGTVSRWTKRDDWPFAKRAPWPRRDVPKILAWVADTLERDAKAEPGGDETKELRKQKLREEIRKLRANAEQAETALARERGDLLDAAAVAQEWGRTGALVRNGFGNLPSQILPLALGHGMPQEAAAEFTRQVEEAVNGVLRHLSRNGQDDDGEAGE